MRQRRETVEHPFGTIKARIGATHYPGKLGVVEEGAIADLVLIDGDPLENIKLVADPDKNFLVIMKGGTIYKDTVTK
jgi:imidazolonepropionase-like amidohydrolase